MDAPSTSDAAAIGDVAGVRALLIEAARGGHALSYSALLARLGVRFTRPKMRALCRTLDAIDREGAAVGEPELAVLVVRESDRLPGQGWWTAHARDTGYLGEWEGPAAAREVQRLQGQAFAHWRNPDRARGVRAGRGDQNGR